VSGETEASRRRLTLS